LARELVFVENNKKLFYTFDYNEDEPQQLDYPKFKDCYIKIFIKKRTKAASFEKYIDKFYEAGVAELAITEEVSTNPELVAVDVHKDTLQLLHEELKTIDDKSIDKKILTKIIDDAYNSALSEDEE
jgi:hypothetical protein